MDVVDNVIARFDPPPAAIEKANSLARLLGLDVRVHDWPLSVSLFGSWEDQQRRTRALERDPIAKALWVSGELRRFTGQEPRGEILEVLAYFNAIMWWTDPSNDDVFWFLHNKMKELYGGPSLWSDWLPSMGPQARASQTHTPLGEPAGGARHSVKKSSEKSDRVTEEERQKIAEYERVALSDGDLLDILGDGVNIVLYPELHRMRDLDEVLGPQGAAIILFEAMPGYGHWCTVFRGAGGDKNLVEFFNPYGGFPDDSLKFIGKDFAAKTHQDRTYLSQLMMDSPYKLSYNQYGFQRHGSGIKTCGRHCASRLLLRELDLEDYRAWILDQARRTGTDADAVVTAITDQIKPKA